MEVAFFKAPITRVLPVRTRTEEVMLRLENTGWRMKLSDALVMVTSSFPSCWDTKGRKMGVP